MRVMPPGALWYLASFWLSPKTVVFELDSKPFDFGGVPRHARFWLCVFVVTKLDIFYLLPLQFSQFYPKVRFAQRVYPNGCFRLKLLFGAVRVENAD